MPSKKETLTVLVIMALFLLLTTVFIGLRSEHLLIAALYLILFFAGLPTRKLAVALLPFALFGISYDWMRICPNYEVNPIDVEGRRTISLTSPAAAKLYDLCHKIARRFARF